MNIEKIVNKIDELINENKITQAYGVLQYWRQDAISNNDISSEYSICNELVGFCRKNKMIEDGHVAIDRCVELASLLQIDNTLSYATTLVNIGTAYQVFGELNLALKSFESAQQIFESNSNANEYNKGALYNNMGLLYAEIGQKEKAKKSFENALTIIEKNNTNKLEVSITLLNLADQYDIDNLANESIIARLVEKAYMSFDDPQVEKNEYYYFVASKCASVFGYYGYFSWQQDLEERIKNK